MVNGKSQLTNIRVFEMNVSSSSVFIRWINRLCAIDDLYVWLHATCTEITGVVFLGKERIRWHFL